MFINVLKGHCSGSFVRYMFSSVTLVPPSDDANSQLPLLCTLVRVCALKGYRSVTINVPNRNSSDTVASTSNCKCTKVSL